MSTLEEGAETGTETLEARGRVDAIIARERARRSRRSQTRAPDFQHGECRLDALYDAFGPGWCERALFVEELRDGGGRVAAYTTARFDARFLELRHAVRGEEGEPDEPPIRWSDTDIDSEGTFIVTLTLHDDPLAEPLDEASDVTIASNPKRLQVLEREELGLVRDRQFGSRRHFHRSKDDLLLESRLNTMSLICLCARPNGVDLCD